MSENGNGTTVKKKVKIVYKQKQTFEVDIMRKQGFLRASELGLIFGVNQNTIYRWAAEQRVDEIKRGRYRYFAAYEFIALYPNMKTEIEEALNTPAGRWSANRLVRVEVPIEDETSEDGSTVEHEAE